MGHWTTEDNDAAEAVDVAACRACGDARVTFVNAGRDAQAICLGCGCCGPIRSKPADALNAWNAMWRNAGEATRDDLGSRTRGATTAESFRNLFAPRVCGLCQGRVARTTRDSDGLPCCFACMDRAAEGAPATEPRLTAEEESRRLKASW